jgi:hypothetical protein
MKILAICPIKFDGTSYYRAYGIFPHLKKLFEDDGIRFDLHPYLEGGGYTWADLLSYDWIFLQRPSLDASKRIKLIEFCKRLKKKIWIDFDDNLFALPMENRVYDDITKEVKDSMFLVLNMADVITVSTPALKESFEKIGVKARIEVIPNAWDFELNGFADSFNEIKQLPPPQQTKVKYLWRGSETHWMDLMGAGEAIMGAIGELQNKVMWAWMGYNPVFLTENVPIEWWSYSKGEDIFEYFRNLKMYAPQVLFFPLRDNHLNRSKSNIAWMEATFAGAVCIAPNWPEWRKPGVINYKDEADLEQKLKNTYQLSFNEVGKPNISHFWEESSDYIRENLSLDIVNLKRKQILQGL